MTLEEAIKHCEEVANDRAGCCEDCAEEHRQLACWLKELKQYREQTNGDLISRQATVERLCKVAEFMNEKRDGLGSPYVMAALFIQDNKDEFPSVTPQPSAEQTGGSLQKEIDFWHIKCTEYEQTIVKMAVELNNTKSILWSANQTDGDLISRQDLLKELEKWDWQELYLPIHFAELVADLPSAEKTAEWIPVSERLPEYRDWYLGIFKEPDTGWINPIPFICDYVGRETKATTKEYWILRGITDEDDCVEYYYNLECVAWMPLPEPYKVE